MRRLRAVGATFVLALAAALVTACGGTGSNAHVPSATTVSGAGKTTSTPATGVAGDAPAEWTTYAGSPSRSGIAPGAPAHPTLRRRFARSVDGQIYAQPLIAGGRIYVATENNTVYAFDTSGRQVWKRHLGAPVSGGSLPCGNIDPSGITGTPVISGGRIYVVAFLHNGPHHVLFGLRTESGSVAARANVDPPNPNVEQQRGALLAAAGRIYVPYGGLYGDCGPFRGFVVSTTPSGGGRRSFGVSGSEAGIWATGGLATQSGTLLLSTGNGSARGSANAVIRLTPSLRRLGFWAPTNWSPLSSTDTDTGSLSPLPVSGDRVFQIGKDGVGYLLRHSLAGVGGQQYGAHVCGSSAHGAAAFRAPLAIVPCGGNLYGLRIGARNFGIAWSNGSGGLVPVIAGDSVFALSRDGALVQSRVSSGREVARAQVGSGATSFPAAAAAGHTLVAPNGAGFVVFSI